MPYKGKIIQWNDVPDYDSWGVDDYWTCEHWMEWHSALEKHFGSDLARKIWNFAYSKSSFGSHHLACRSNNIKFMDWAIKNNLETNNSFLTDAWATSNRAVTNIRSFIGNIFEGIGNTGKTLKIVVPLAVIGIVGIYVYRIYKRS